jgi:cardiolipin synthase
MQEETTAPQLRKPIKQDKLELVFSGEDFFERLLIMIAKAKKLIHIQTYIFADDKTGNEVVHELLKARERGVEIYILVDAYGSKALSSKWIANLKKHGINFRYFSTLFSREMLYLGRRLHHKLTVVDGEVALIGGINIADKYRGIHNQLPWLDYSVQFRSKIAEYLQTLCDNIYNKKKKTKKSNPKPAFDIDGGKAFILQNDWIKRKDEIRKSYIHLLRKAQKEVIIVGSYFHPGRRIKFALKKAIHNGAKVKIILSGISDVPFEKRATSYLYDWLLREKIELYEWTETVLHGKAAIVDGKISTIGSFNLNHLSAYGSMEMNVEIHSKEFATNFHEHIDNIISKCQQITAEDLKKKNGTVNKFLNWYSYQVVRGILTMVTYFPYKKIFKRYRLD